MPGFEVLYQAAALCLMYPDDDFRTRLPLLREAAPQLRAFADHAALTPPLELAAHYVEVFEAGQDHSLYLSVWREDAPAPSEELYRAHGLETTGEEPPDFLPAVLECAARTGDTELLAEHRDGLERLRSKLTDFGTPYATVLDAVCATLPPVAMGR
ncbi:nitrate reductase [Streptomyces sp. NRRL B-1140]|uniref:nitrate reductase molybdenum cofactor assembly chaperone n=1 Tax=Streptomyces sp. NRRL B-1140 TaxID=1415549 RepID=UPI0006AE1974|nr:molecular chaperone TorD family protein [Streptomyces sp. NRRL B-1140]KOV96478.1 nitrate reductase [Streptomyces sp. NRRL B-1140]